jgi:hypothetical protein
LDAKGNTKYGETLAEEAFQCQYEKDKTNLNRIKVFAFLSLTITNNAYDIWLLLQELALNEGLSFFQYTT